MSKKDEFAKMWLDSGGFIPQNIAAEILEVTPPTINRLVKSGKMKAYRNQYPLLQAVMNYEPQPNMKRTKKRNEE